MQHNIMHVDEKALVPMDKSSALSPEMIQRHYEKPTRGYVVVSDGNTGETLEVHREGPNLVLLGGREFLAQKLADLDSPTLLPVAFDDLTKFKIRYFGVGIGGADTAQQPNKIGPFDNELDLRLPGKFADIDSTNYQYLHGGNLKSIYTDGGNIEIVRESHEIVINGASVIIDAFTTIKYTMFIRKDELYKEITESGPFAFNEAALYAVDFENDIPAMTDAGTAVSRYSAKFRTFARFTTMTKWLEVKDSLKIEWFILV